MAKKDREKMQNQEERGGGKILTVLIIFLIVLIWLAILALLIKFDVGGLGSGVLRPVLKDIPVINRILPDVSEEQEAYENAYPFKTLSEAMEYIKKLELEADKLREENDDYASRQIEMQKEIQIMISGKKYEQRIMSLVPMGVMAYMSITSKGFFDVLYHNGLGIAIMSVCLLVYGVAVGLGEHLAKIEV